VASWKEDTFKSKRMYTCRFQFGVDVQRRRRLQDDADVYFVVFISQSAWQSQRGLPA
jgi:hypothetical protein